jgi:hypothetical protein
MSRLVTALILLTFSGVASAEPAPRPLTAKDGMLEVERLKRNIRALPGTPPPDASEKGQKGQKDQTREVGGTVRFVWSDYHGSTNIDMRLSTYRPGPGYGLMSTLQVDANGAKISLRPGLPNAVEESYADIKWPRLVVSLNHQRAGAEAATLMAQLTACPTLLTTPANIDYSYAYHTPTWEVELNLAPTQFQAFRDAIRKRQPGEVVSLPTFELNDVLGISCSSFTIVQT